MKDCKSYIAILLLAGLAACNGKVDPAQDMLPISVQAEFGPETKAAGYDLGDVESEVQMRSNKFGFMGYDSANHTLNTTADALNKGISSMWKGSFWSYSNDDTYYWSNYTQPLDFYAYYPLQGLDMTAEKFQKAYYPAGDVMTLTKWQDGVDVLYARTTGQYSTPKVALNFKHAFTKIEKINFKISDQSHLTFHIGAVELTATHCETDAKVIVRKTGEPVYVAGSTPTNRMVTHIPEIVVNKYTTSGANLIVGTDNAFMFPVATSDIWDGTVPAGSTDEALNKTCVHLLAKVKQGEETILQGSGEYVIGSETQYGDIYIPIKGALNASQALEAGKRYTINIYLKSGVGYNKDGKTYLPIELTVDVDDWVEDKVTIGQVTVAPSYVTLNEANSYSADITVNAGTKELTNLSATCSSNLTVSAFRLEGEKVKITIGRASAASTGSGTVTVNDAGSNSMTSVSVTIE